MIVKKEESAQFTLFPVNKPLYTNCKTCARLVPNGICEACGVPYTTKTPWGRMSEMKPPKARRITMKSLSTPENIRRILEQYK